MSDINALSKVVFANAVSKGFWKVENPNETPAETAHRLFGEKIALIHSEVSEALEEYRNGRALNETYWPAGGPRDEEGRLNKPEGIPSELADIVIRVMDLAFAAGIDLGEAVTMKMEFNSTRPHMHGGKRI